MHSRHFALMQLRRDARGEVVMGLKCPTGTAKHPVGGPAGRDECGFGGVVVLSGWLAADHSSPIQRVAVPSPEVTSRRR